MADRVQITTDGYGAYRSAIEQAFGEDVDHGVVVKIYENDRGSGRLQPTLVDRCGDHSRSGGPRR